MPLAAGGETCTASRGPAALAAWINCAVVSRDPATNAFDSARAADADGVLPPAGATWPASAGWLTPAKSTIATTGALRRITLSHDTRIIRRTGTAGLLNDLPAFPAAG